jgi:hypothetical protein
MMAEQSRQPVLTGQVRAAAKRAPVVEKEPVVAEPVDTAEPVDPAEQERRDALLARAMAQAERLLHRAVPPQKPANQKPAK